MEIAQKVKLHSRHPSQAQVRGASWQARKLLEVYTCGEASKQYMCMYVEASSIAPFPIPTPAKIDHAG